VTRTHLYTLNTDSALQLARTEMSPAKHSEHSRKQRQRTGPRKKGARSFLPEILVLWARNSLSALQLARTEMSPAEHSQKQRQRTGSRKKGARNFLPEILVLWASNTDSALQFARTEISPVEHSWKHRQRTLVRKRRVRETSYRLFLCKTGRQIPIAPRNWPEPKCYLRNIRGNIVSWSAKEGCEKRLTRNFRAGYTKLR